MMASPSERCVAWNYSIRVVKAQSKIKDATSRCIEVVNSIKSIDLVDFSINIALCFENVDSITICGFNS